MSDYCDSSFLIGLYLHEPGLSEEAQRVASRWKDAALLSPLSHLETLNGFSRKVFTNEISQEESDRAISKFERDIADGLFELVPLNLAVMFRDARELSLRHTPGGGYRSLDLLHIAAAKMLGAKTFLSFDARLNVLAKKEKIKVLP